MVCVDLQSIAIKNRLGKGFNRSGPSLLFELPQCCTVKQQQEQTNKQTGLTGKKLEIYVDHNQLDDPLPIISCTH